MVPRLKKVEHIRPFTKVDDAVEYAKAIAAA